MNESAKESKLLRGGCYCDTVQFEVADEFRYAMNCHCSDCRRATGSAFKPFAGIAREKLRLTKGDENLLRFGDPAADHDVHCQTCGSLLYSVLQAGTRLHVVMGTLLDEPSIRPAAHIFVSDKAPWFEITDTLPQFVEHAT